VIQVGRQHPAPVLGRHLGKGDAPVHARIVHQTAHCAMRGQNLCHHRAQRGLVGQVAAIAGDPGRHGGGLRQAILVQINGRHQRTLRGKGQRGGASDPGTGASDNHMAGAILVIA